MSLSQADQSSSFNSICTTAKKSTFQVNFKFARSIRWIHSTRLCRLSIDSIDRLRRFQGLSYYIVLDLIFMLSQLAASEATSHLQDGDIDVQGSFVVDASIPERPDPARCSYSASAIFRRPMMSAARTRTEFARRALSVAAPHNWNSLPSDIRSCHTLHTFKNTSKHTCLDNLILKSPAPLYPLQDFKAPYKYCIIINIIILIINIFNVVVCAVCHHLRHMLILESLRGTCFPKDSVCIYLNIYVKYKASFWALFLGL